MRGLMELSNAYILSVGMLLLGIPGLPTSSFNLGSIDVLLQRLEPKIVYPLDCSINLFCVICVVSVREKNVWVIKDTLSKVD